MLIPVRCFTCGKVLADKWEAYERRCKDADDAEAKKGKERQGKSQGEDEGGSAAGGKTARGKILDDLGITQGCCRTIMLTHVDMSLVI